MEVEAHFEKHQNTGSSLMEEERNLAQNEFRKILCSSQVMFPIPPWLMSISTRKHQNMQSVWLFVQIFRSTIVTELPDQIRELDCTCCFCMVLDTWSRHLCFLCFGRFPSVFLLLDLVTFSFPLLLHFHTMQNLFIRGKLGLSRSLCKLPLKWNYIMYSEA